MTKFRIKFIAYNQKGIAKDHTFLTDILDPKIITDTLYNWSFSVEDDTCDSAIAYLVYNGGGLEYKLAEINMNRDVKNMKVNIPGAKELVFIKDLCYESLMVSLTNDSGKDVIRKQSIIAGLIKNKVLTGSLTAQGTVKSYDRSQYKSILQSMLKGIFK